MKVVTSKEMRSIDAEAARDEREMDDVLVFVGGIIPDADIPALEALGVDAVFQPGAPLSEIVDLLHERLKPS